MTHGISIDDENFQCAFEAMQVAPANFDHAAHVRLAYVYLCRHPVDEAAAAMKRAILGYLNHLGVGETKYHETMTRAWVMAVDFFMKKNGVCPSSADFMRRSPELLDSKIMLTHYSAQTLFSAEARRQFVTPDIQSIPPV